MPDSFEKEHCKNKHDYCKSKLCAIWKRAEFDRQDQRCPGHLDRPERQDQRCPGKPKSQNLHCRGEDQESTSTFRGKQHSTLCVLDTVFLMLEKYCGQRNRESEGVPVKF